MKKFVIAKYLLLLLLNAHAQKHDNVWSIGGGNGTKPNLPDIGVSFIDFSNNDSLFKYSPEDKGYLYYRQTCANICDKAGKLAFCSNGERIENWAYDTIATKGPLFNKASIYGVTIVQGTLILPFPEKDSLYLILYEEPGFLPFTLEFAIYYAYYSIIDMSKNNGKGAVVELKKPIPKITAEYFPCYGKLCAIRQPNGIDWWIYTMKLNANVFYRYALTKDGFSFVDTFTYGAAVKDGEGGANFSPNGKYHARYNNVSKDIGQYLDVYDYDRCTGKFSNQRNIHYIGQYGAGVAFSPNSRYLYVAVGKELLQYDMEATDFATSKRIISRIDGVRDCHNVYYLDYYNCQLAPNGKIYIVPAVCSQFLHVIENPDLPDTLCQLKQHSVSISTRTGYSLPNFPNFRLGKAECMIAAADVAEAEGISIYPNPAQDILNVVVAESDEKLQIECFDIQGRSIYKSDFQHLTQINISNWQRGLYAYTIRDERGRLVKSDKVIVE